MFNTSGIARDVLTPHACKYSLVVSPYIPVAKSIQIPGTCFQSYIPFLKYEHCKVIRFLVLFNNFDCADSQNLKFLILVRPIFYENSYIPSYNNV